jgi:DNA-nicking Smr family endonuclease
MAKKKQPEKEPALPKFGGWGQLAGLGELKDKLAKEESAAKKPPAPPPKPRARAPEARTPEKDRDDELAFHRMMSGVTPLDAKTGRVPVSSGNSGGPRAKANPAEIRAKARVEAEEVLDHLHHLVDDAVRFEVSDDGRHVEGRRVDVPPKLLRELRRGALPIDGRLDLHGLGAEAAREKLLEFLRLASSRRERCVLVIHGKGEHSPMPGGVLRGEISAWLSQGRAREFVAAFATACKEDGGEGAVYVAIRIR